MTQAQLHAQEHAQLYSLKINQFKTSVRWAFAPRDVAEKNIMEAILYQGFGHINTMRSNILMLETV
jgi:hypothetical protein